MAKQIVSVNFGVTLIVRERGKEKKVQLSGLFPSPAHQTPESTVRALTQFFADHSGKNKAVRQAARGKNKAVRQAARGKK